MAEMAETRVLASCGHRESRGEIRRTLCNGCYRKLRAAGCDLPPRSTRWDDHDALSAWARTLPDDTRRRLLAALLDAPRTDHRGSDT